MGDELHITRAKCWIDSGAKPITAEEWLALVERDPSLRLAKSNGEYFALWNASEGKESGAWLDWKDGEIFSKNPDEALIEKMVTIATELGATVQGGDDEVYAGGGAAPRPARLSAGEWIRAKVQNLMWGVRAARSKTENEKRLAEISSAFHVGQKVKGVFGNEGVVTNINAKEPAGIGRISVRFANGKETHFALAASGLVPLPPEEGL